MKEQAGILAQNLREAEPCPVCGSLTHPHPASLAENAISEAAVKAAKEQREQAETARDTAYQEFDRQKSAAAEQELRLEQAKQQFLALAGDACGDGEKELYTVCRTAGGKRTCSKKEVSDRAWTAGGAIFTGGEKTSRGNGRGGGSPEA